MGSLGTPANDRWRATPSRYGYWSVYLALLLDKEPLTFTCFAGAAIFVAVAVWLGSPCNRLVKSVPARLMISALLVTNALWAFYAVSGMGHILLSALLIAGAYAYARAVETGRVGLIVASGAVFAVAAIARPEGLGLFLATLGFEIVRAVPPAWSRTRCPTSCAWRRPSPSSTGHTSSGD